MTKTKSIYLALFVVLLAPVSANAVVTEITDSGVDGADGVWFGGDRHRNWGWKFLSYA